MSIIHNIIPKNELDINTLANYLDNVLEDFAIEQRGETNFYMWINHKSTRGVDLSFEENNILEIRNTILSNKHDYILTNKLIETIVHLTDGKILDEDDTKINAFPVFSEERIKTTEINDCKTILLLSKSEQEIAIFGPIRKVHFGPKIYNKLKFSMENEKEMVENVFKIILNVQYHIPNYEYGNILQTDNKNDEKPAILKLLTNEVDCLIDKYDYIIFNKDNKIIMITNNDLNSILPKQWNLVDEYTVIAPILPEKEWKTLVTNAEKIDKSESFMN